jgi:hypothetical protein
MNVDIYTVLKFDGRLWSKATVRKTDNEDMGGLYYRRQL